MDGGGEGGGSEGGGGEDGGGVGGGGLCGSPNGIPGGKFGVGDGGGKGGGGGEGAETTNVEAVGGETLSTKTPREALRVAKLCAARVRTTPVAAVAVGVRIVVATSMLPATIRRETSAPDTPAMPASRETKSGSLKLSSDDCSVKLTWTVVW